MNHGKQGLKVLGVSLLAALGLMAFGAGGAQASGSFLIEGLSGLWEATVTGEGENLLEGGSRVRVLGLNAEVFCHAGTATGKITAHGHGHATLNFTNCLVSGTNNDATGTLKGAVCTLEENLVAKVLTLVILHNSKPYLLFTPLDGLTFMEISGEPCLPTAAYKGSQVASISNPDGDDVTKLISTKGMASLFPTHTLKYGVNSAHLTVDATVKLAGAHTGLAWGAV
jgi:hypothetical protein